MLESQPTSTRLSRLIAFRKAGTLYYVGTDHPQGGSAAQQRESLGSTVRVADASFSPVDGMRYKPYGEGRDPGSSLNTDRRFTSQTEDASVGLYWYQSRAYDPLIGRFTQPDAIVPEPGNPQSLNRYSYGFNNPVKYSDPSGHDPLDSQWEAEWAAAHPGKTLTNQDKIDRLFSYRSSAIMDRPWTDIDWIQYNGLKQSGTIDPTALVLKGTRGTMEQRIKLASALITLEASGKAGRGLYNSFIDGGGVVQYGGGPFRRANTAIGYDNTAYLDEGWQGWSAEITASFIAHESYHAQQGNIRYPYRRSEEVGAFTREAAVWQGLRVSYNGPRDALWQQREDILAASRQPDGLRKYVDSQPLYREPFYIP